MAFYAVSVVTDEALVRRWAGEHGLTAPIATTTGNLLTALGVEGAPATVAIAGGRLVGVAAHGADARDLEAMIAALAHVGGDERGVRGAPPVK